MSRLEKLIRQLCPDGVEYKKLKDCTEMKRGSSATKSTLVSGGIPVISGGKEPAFYCNVANRDGETITVAGSGAGAGYVQYWNIPIFVNDAFSVKGLEIANTKYVYYAMTNLQEDIYSTKKGSGVPHVHISSIENFLIPVPPLQVQQEIVRILDQFTGFTAELAAELTAELTARKKQYEHYRDELFVFDGETTEKHLEAEFPSIRNGFVGTITSFFSDKEHGIRYLEGRDIHNGIISDDKAVYVTKDFHNKHLKTQLKPDDIVVVQSGHVGECAVVGDKYAGANCHALIVMSNGGNCDSRYVAYYLQSSEGKRKLASITTGGTVKHILASKIKKLPVPFPPIEEQHRIVAILDRFDALCNNLTNDLLAEIEARRKQYEYYRDKLLTFKEVR